MNVRSIMSGPAIEAPPQASITTVGKLMADAGVGAVVIVDDEAVVGIVTDRDIVTRAVALRRPLEAHVAAVMTTNVVTLDAATTVDGAYEAFRRVAFRRLPVLDKGALIGMLTIDDLLLNLSRRTADLAGPVSKEILEPAHEAALPASP
jgi:signal-transduction protein with cAMP-binding, CBS, and nucleotidyltransferase domain